MELWVNPFHAVPKNSSIMIFQYTFELMTSTVFNYPIKVITDFCNFPDCLRYTCASDGTEINKKYLSSNYSKVKQAINDSFNIFYTVVQEKLVLPPRSTWETNIACMNFNKHHERKVCLLLFQY